MMIISGIKFAVLLVIFSAESECRECRGTGDVKIFVIGNRVYFTAKIVHVIIRD